MCLLTWLLFGFAVEKLLKRIAHRYLAALLIDFNSDQLDVAFMKGIIKLEQASCVQSKAFFFFPEPFFFCRPLTPREQS